MIKPKFPGMGNIKVDEGLLMIKMLKKDGNSAKEIKDFLIGIDECLGLQKAASLIDKYKGKRKHNTATAKDIIYERASQIIIT